MSHSKFWKDVFENNPGLVIQMKQRPHDDVSVSLQSDGSFKISFAKATAFGDNYMSDAFLATAHLENGSKRTAFVKIVPHNSYLFVLAITQKLHYHEAAFYQHLRSTLHNVRSEIGLSSKDVPLNVPKMYYVHSDETENPTTNLTVLVLEDLKRLGYKMIDKRSGCTLHEAKLALSALANFHALSMAVVKTKWRKLDPNGALELPKALDFLQRFQIVMFGATAFDLLMENATCYLQMMKDRGHHEVCKHDENTTNPIGYTSQIVDHPGDFVQWFQAARWLANDLHVNGRRALTTETVEECGPMLCILHGDCWSNNLLFKYDACGSPVSTRLVDWQNIHLGHPGQDIALFLFTSTSPELRQEFGQYLLDHYFDVLSSARKKVGLEPYDRNDFQAEVEQRYRFGLLKSLLILPTVLDVAVIDAMEVRDSESARPSKFDMDEMMNDIKETFDMEKLFTNAFLCDRLIAMVEEVKRVLE